MVKIKLILNTEIGLYEKDGQAFCDSLMIAETFEKRHSDVLRDIERIIDNILKINERKFAEINFIKTMYKDERNRKQPKYMLTKSGFTKIAFGYEGDKATRFQIDYIRRFELMESFIKSLLTTKMEFPAFTEAVMLAHDEPKHYHFSNEINMIYRIVLGMDAKAYRKQHNIEDKEVIRPFLNAWQINAIETLQRVDIGLLEVNLDYEQRKEILHNRYQKMLIKLSA